MAIDVGHTTQQPDTLPGLGSTGPRMGTTPVEPARNHPVPAIDKPLHIVPSDDGWLLRFESDHTVAGIYPTKAKAMTAARALAEARGLRLVEHGADGRIRS